MCNVERGQIGEQTAKEICNEYYWGIGSRGLTSIDEIHGVTNDKAAAERSGQE